MTETLRRPTPELLLAAIHEHERPKLRVYIGAAAGVGKTYQMLEDAHQLRRQGVDIVIGFIETHGRVDTEALLAGLERVPTRAIEYRGAVLPEMDVEAIKRRAPAIAIVDELAHTNVPGSAHAKRFEDVLELLDAGISIITAVNIQHLESLNDAVAQATGVQVRETVPDSVLKRADEVVNVDVSVDTLRTRLRQGKIYGVEKIEQALTSFFRKGNLSALRELALRQVATEEATRGGGERLINGEAEPTAVSEKVMVAIASRGNAKRLLRAGSRIAGRYASGWYAVWVETPGEGAGRIDPHAHAVLMENLTFARSLGATVITLKATRVADALVEFAKQTGITHVIFGQSARSRLDLLLHGSVVNRFLREVRDATVHVVPMDKA
jgi:two-component system sensor histidine kinase KdpD